jgi:diguanylate cyclase (GGDEF)-like protein
MAGVIRMDKQAAVNREKFDHSLDSITASLRSFIELSLQGDDRIWGDWIASAGGKVEIRCWERKNCRNTDCPAYKSECGRCWLLAGSLCGSARPEEDSRPEMTNCFDCEIYRANVCRDPISEIREQIITLVHNLRVRQLELKEMAIHDPLTGLKNRRFFDMYIRHEVERVNRSQESLAILSIDVNDFKAVNDDYGHIFGDKILKECAAVMQKTIRGTDLLFRFGGDEFIVVMNKAGEHEAEILRQRLNDRLSAWNASHEGNGPRVSVSVGYAILTPNRELVEVLSEADMQMYRDKKRRKEMAGLP